ncbi:MAG: ABC transporter substrate-binding protein [Carboxylicivirga sp.]|jgi:iron complex transport system substrate-binding protein|nr:ABC transporter substrate-binding protein [Carboxylicivirga sp.]
MIRFLTIAFAFVVILGACQTKQGGKISANAGLTPDSTYIPKYARGFEVKYFKGYRQIVLNDPWGDTTKTETIALYSDTTLLEKLRADNDYVLKAPAQKWIALSSTMVNYAEQLKMENTIVGVAEPQYISNQFIQDGIKKGSIRNVGMAVSPDVEVMVDIEPDFMMVSPFKDNHFAAVVSAGIPVITNSDYLEYTPLGRAEWLVFMGEMLGKGNEAKDRFAKVEKAYIEIKQKVAKIKNKPSVFTGHIYQGIWYTPAGESYMANFFKDAGFNYIYKESKGTGSLSLDYETIIEKAEKTDYWLLIINFPGELSYSEISKIDKRYTDFDAFKNRKMIVTNSSTSRYFEKGVLEPDIVLSDMVYAFNPQLLPDYQPKYFKRLTKEK